MKLFVLQMVPDQTDSVTSVIEDTATAKLILDLGMNRNPARQKANPRKI